MNREVFRRIRLQQDGWSVLAAVDVRAMLMSLGWWIAVRYVLAGS